jgi:hypothetical protein
VGRVGVGVGGVRVDMQQQRAAEQRQCVVGLGSSSLGLTCGGERARAGRKAFGWRRGLRALGLAW